VTEPTEKHPLDRPFAFALIRLDGADMWLEGHDIAGPGEGWKMVDSGATEIDGDFPVNPSGGVLSSNPVGASGMLRCAEAALQVRGRAGEHQVDGAKVALAQAYGANAQFFAMWIVASEL
jgi:acetyl-CoA C-acetyltransferase